MGKTEIGFDTGNIQNASKALEEAGTDFVEKYQHLQDVINSTAITGPVKEALKAKLQEKEDMFNAVKKTIGNTAEFTAAKAIEGAKLIDGLIDNDLH